MTEKETTIIDIIQPCNKWKQTFIILNRKPEFVYDKIDNWLIAEDNGFFSFYYFEKPVGRSKAFAGREFDIPLKTGEIIKATGQWWDGVPEEYKHKVKSVGYGTVDSLSRCYVFCHVYIANDTIDTWLAEQEASNNYNLYREKHGDYGKRVI